MSPTVRVLATRTDALVLRASGVVRQGLRSEVLTRLEDMRRAGVSGCSLDLGGVPYALSRHGTNANRFRLANASSEVLVDEGVHLAGWNVEVKSRATSLATLGLERSIEALRSLAEVVLADVDRLQTRRIDLAADMVGLPPGAIESKALVGPPRAKTVRHLSEHTQGPRTTGYRVGSGDLSARIYDKSQELKDGRDDTKLAIEESIWSQALAPDGRPLWSRGDQVTRVEFQLRGNVLDELLDGRLRDPYVLPDVLDEIWSYGTRRWLRLVDRSSAPRPTRCTTDERWLAVQRASFGASEGVAVPECCRTRGLAGARFAMGVLINFLAGRGALPDLGGLLETDESAVDFLERIAASAEALSAAPGGAPCKREGMFEGLFREMVERVIGSAIESLCADFLEELGPRRSAATLIERARYARARATTTEAIAVQCDASLMTDVSPKHLLVVDDLVRAAAGPFGPAIAEAIGTERRLGELIDRATAVRGRTTTLDDVA